MYWDDINWNNTEYDTLKVFTILDYTCTALHYSTHALLSII